MKICIISFDFWNYDEHIVNELKLMGHEAYHINLGAYKHKNFGARLHNTFSKIFLNKNLKDNNRLNMIIDELRNLGKQDQILVINPEVIPRKMHEQIKNKTSRYIAYLYDSLARNPAEHLFDLFDEIFSFDPVDSKKHNFQFITNYNYLTEETYQDSTKYDLVYLASIDSRLKIAKKIGDHLLKIGGSFLYYIQGKKAWKEMIKQYLSEKYKGQIKYKTKRLPHREIPEFYRQGKVILDLVRDHQHGLSFRIFEAMALKKKVITNNQTVLAYDFYDPNNIMVVNDHSLALNKEFITSQYQELSPEIYYKYTLKNWVSQVFNLEESK